jgi:hypothetical protein
MSPLVLTWRTSDTDRLRGLLEAVGFRAGEPGELHVDGLVLRVEPGGPEDRLEPAGERQVPYRHAAPPRPPARLLAVGVATVDAWRDGATLGPLRDLADDLLLGCRVVATADPRLVLLEPATEGRLAATLARQGEGPAAIYVASPAPLGEVVAALVHDGRRPREGSGPFGRQVLARAGSPWGPHVLVTSAVVPGAMPVPDRSATIRS